MCKIRITDLNELKQRLQNRVGQAGSRRHCGSHSSVASSIAPDQWCAFCTRNIPTYSNKWIQIWRIRRTWSGLNFGVTYSGNLVVAGTRWVFQVSQGSVRRDSIQVRWKRFNYFAANLFRKQYTVFHLSRPSFIKDVTKTFCFFPTRCILLVIMIPSTLSLNPPPDLCRN